MRSRLFLPAGLCCFLVGLVTSSLLAADNDTLEKRRIELEQMSDAEKTALLGKKKRFDDMDPAEQEKYRELHRKLVTQPDYKRLRATLQRYTEWVKSLPSVERAELSELPPNERLQRVRELMDAQAQERFRMMLKEVSAAQDLLSREDMQAILKWTDDFLENHKAEIVEMVGDSRFTETIMNDYEHDKHIHFLRYVYFRGSGSFDWGSRRGPESGQPPGEGGRKLDPDGPDPHGRQFGSKEPDSGGPPRPVDEQPKAEPPKPTDEEIQQLLKSVSSKARDALAAATEEAERLQILRNWMRAAAFSRYRPPVGREELDRFVRDGGLASEEREWLESLPRDRVFHELRKIYYRKNFQGGRGRMGGGQGGRDGRTRDGGGRGGRGGSNNRGPSFDRGAQGDPGRREADDQPGGQDGRSRQKRL